MIWEGISGLANAQYSITGVAKINMAQSPLDTLPAQVVWLKYTDPGWSFLSKDMYTMPIMKVGMAMITATTSRANKCLCSL